MENPEMTTPEDKTTLSEIPPEFLEEEARAAAKPVFDPTVLQRVFDKTTVTGAAAMAPGGELIPRKRLEFIIDQTELAPGLFASDVQVTLVALTSTMEIRATKGVTDPQEVVAVYAKAALELLNGAPILGDQVDWLWEALGPGGRQLVMYQYQKIGSMTPVGMGKSEASCTVR